MPFTLLVILAAVGASWARGGRLHRISEGQLHASWLLFTGLALQILVDITAPRVSLPDPVFLGGLLASQALVVAWIWHNRYRRGMPLVALGLVLNAVVIAANGAMPVSVEALRAAGLTEPESLTGKHVLAGAGTRLPLLADVIPVRPLRTVISAGDVVLAAGVIPLVHDLMTQERASLRRRRGHPPVEGLEEAPQEGTSGIG